MEEDTAHRPPEQNTANAFAWTDAVKLLSTAISTQFQQLTEKLQEDNKSSAQQLSKKFKENIAGKLKYEGNKVQYLFNEEILDELEKLKDLSKYNENVVKRINDKLKTRQKYIRMADGSPWLQGGKRFRNTNAMISLTTRTTRKRSGVPRTELSGTVNRESHASNRTSNPYPLLLPVLLLSCLPLLYNRPTLCRLMLVPRTRSTSPFDQVVDVPHSPATSATGASRLGIGRPDVPSTSPQVQIPSDLDDKYLLSVDMFERITNNEIMNEHCKLLSIIESNQSCICVKNSLQNHYEFWRKIGAFEDILRLIKTGYNIPFAVNPPRIYLKNNKSALQNFSFVTESIGDLVKSGCVIQVPFRSFVVSPLSVAENREKKRLILDLSMLNGFLKKEKIKFEDHKLALQYFENNCFCIKFDLKSGYHHIDICKECQTFLGFEWKGEYYCFTVLPFGLSTAPYIFTKCLRAMVKYWRSNNIKIVLYLDDGLAMAESFEECQRISSFIKSSLEDAGLLINQEKSIFSPVQDIEWLGIRWNSVRFSISIPERRIQDVESTIVQFLSDLPKVSA